MARLEGKVALVTGAGMGIGKAIAERYAQEGAVVFIVERDEHAGQAVAEQISQAGGGAHLVVCDVSQRDQITGAVQTAIDGAGRLDILVNNAISLSPNVLLEDKTDEMLEDTLKVGLWATWWAMRAAMPTMRDQGGGRVINMYSIDAESAAWFHADYNIAKEAVRGLTRSAAAEWGRHNILVNAIAPGAAGNVFWKLAAQDPSFEQRAANMRPMSRIGDPDTDVAPIAVFLASEDSGWVTGEVLHADGGLHLARYSSRPSEV